MRKNTIPAIVFAAICIILVILAAFAIKVSAVEASPICGDVNGDGTVDIRDATAIQMWLAGGKPDSNIGKPIIEEPPDDNEDNVSIEARDLFEGVSEFKLY